MGGNKKKDKKRSKDKKKQKRKEGKIETKKEIVGRAERDDEYDDALEDERMKQTRKDAHAASAQVVSTKRSQENDDDEIDCSSDNDEKDVEHPSRVRNSPTTSTASTAIISNKHRKEQHDEVDHEQESSKEQQQQKEEDVAADGQEVLDPKQEEMKGDIEDTTNILSDSTFDTLGITSQPLLNALKRLEWNTATQIQKQVIPEALQGNDIIGLAETGSGKTGAFTLPIFQLMLNSGTSLKHKTVALILTPTRELAFQIHQVVQALSVTMGVTSAVIVGGVDRTSQAIALARFPHILIATPGRLLDHLKDTKGFHLRHVRFLVLDEADRMLSLDFEQELHAILDNLQENEEERQAMLFSATMTSQVQKLQRASLKKNAVRVDVSTTKFQTPKTLQQYYLFIPAKYKDCYFTYLINEHVGQSILVFAATCNNVQRLTLMLRNLGFPAVCLHGQMHQSKRLGMLSKFSSGSRSILISTDVASRGLDLPNVDLVINFDLPNHGKEYVHRVGRTARAGKAGKAIAMVTQYDVEVYQRIETLLGTKLPDYAKHCANEETVLVLLERVNEAQRLATRELKEELASRGAGKGGGGRRKRRMGGADDDGEDGGLEAKLKKELRQGYAGGSGGHGGALHNQRGSGKQKKKYRRN